MIVMKSLPGFTSRLIALTLCALMASAAFVPDASMQSIDPSRTGGGGGASSHGNLRVEGSIGQHATSTSSNGSLTLNSGFWPSVTPCLSLSRPNFSFTALGGNGSVEVLGLAPCNWNVVNNSPSFITITSGGGGGTGDGTISFSVPANTGSSPRSGTLTIAGQTFTVFQGIQFNDVPPGHPFFNEIGKLSARSITLGCDSSNYCPDLTVTRQQMAAFIIRALGDFNPPTPAMQRFLDVPPSNFFYAFIEQMAVRQITLGCGGGNYCPTDPVLRNQMAAFIIRALGDFNPPQPATQRFLDVPPSNPFYSFIEQMALRGITLGCGGGNYCPSLAVSRGQMAAFLVRAFNL